MSQETIDITGNPFLGLFLSVRPGSGTEPTVPACPVQRALWKSLCGLGLPRVVRVRPKRGDHRGHPRAEWQGAEGLFV
jgi:hypothetical protein